MRTIALRDKFLAEEDLTPPDAFFVSAEFIRSYQTIAPLETVLGVPVRRYIAKTDDQADIALQVSQMDPCPQTAMVITHGDHIVAIFNQFGVDVSQVPDITTFGKIFTLTRDEVDAPHVTEVTYGVSASEGDQNFPPVSLDPMILAGQTVCEPSTFYLIRHAERFQAALGNGFKNKKKTCTRHTTHTHRERERESANEELCSILVVVLLWLVGSFVSLFFINNLFYFIFFSKGLDDSQEILTAEGFLRAEDLVTKFTDVKKKKTLSLSPNFCCL